MFLLLVAGMLRIATGFFAAFVIAAVWNGINCRALDGTMPPFFKGKPTVFDIIAAMVDIQSIVVQIGGPVFNTVPLYFERYTRRSRSGSPILKTWR